MDEIAYPSEILDPRFASEKIDPKLTAWIRFLARMVDYSIFFMALHFLKNYGVHLPEYFLYYFPLLYVYFIPIEAVCLRVFKKTPGKALLGMTVAAKQKKPGIASAFRRSFAVYLRGFGCGIYIFPIFTMSVAYSHLLQRGKTSWDFQEEIEIRHKIPGSSQVFFSLFLIIVAFFMGRAS